MTIETTVDMSQVCTITSIIHIITNTRPRVQHLGKFQSEFPSKMLRDCLTQLGMAGVQGKGRRGRRRGLACRDCTCYGNHQERGNKGRWADGTLRWLLNFKSWRGWRGAGSDCTSRRRVHLVPCSQSVRALSCPAKHYYYSLAVKDDISTLSTQY